MRTLKNKFLFQFNIFFSNRYNKQTNDQEDQEIVQIIDKRVSEIRDAIFNCG